MNDKREVIMETVWEWTAGGSSDSIMIGEPVLTGDVPIMMEDGESVFTLFITQEQLVEMARAILARFDQGATASPTAWIVWTCEGNMFESETPRSQLSDRVAELQADDTITDVRIEGRP